MVVVRLCGEISAAAGAAAAALALLLLLLLSVGCYARLCIELTTVRVLQSTACVFKI
jgi:hypothetical protein